MTPSPNLNPRFFILQDGDIIEFGDEYYNPTYDTWMPVQPSTIGDEWWSDESKPVRRTNSKWKPQLIQWSTPYEHLEA